MLQGIPARIVERLWPRERVMESQRKRPLNAMAHMLVERGPRGREGAERVGTRVGRLTSGELFSGVQNSDAIGALPCSAGERADDEAGNLTVALGRFDALIGRGLSQILNDDRNLRIIAADLDNAALEHTVARQSPHVAIIDEASIVMSSVLERLRTARPTIGIVVLAHHPTVAYAMRLMAGGASCLAKDASAADILAAAHIVADGRRVFVDVDGHLIERGCPVTAAASLTPREGEVLEYLSRGQSHAEIAHALQLGIETIRTHSAHIRGKLGVRNKRELIGLTVPFQAARGLVR